MADLDRRDLFTLLEEYRDYKKPTTLELLIQLLEQDKRLVVPFGNQTVFLDGLETLVKVIVDSDKIDSISILQNDLSTYGDKLVPVFSKVSELTLSGTNIGRQALVDGLKGNISIKELILPKNDLGDEEIKALANALSNNGTITHLDISGNQCRAEGAKHLCEAMSSMSSLKNVYLHSNPLGPMAGTSLAKFIEASSSLELLDIKSTELGNEGITQIAPSLMATKSLVTLDISGNQIAARAINEVADCLRRNHSISSLFMSRNDFGDASLEGFTALLQENKSLTLLDMNWNGIAQKGAKTLLNALPLNQVLTTIDLSKNVLNLADITEFSHVLLFTPITSCNMLDNDIDNETAKQLVKRPLNLNKACKKFNLGTQMKILFNNELLPRDLLRDDQIYNFLVEFTQQQISRRQVKVAILGDSGIGKSTLVSLFSTHKQSFWEQMKGMFMRSAKSKAKPTHGMDQIQIDVSNDGKLTVWDFSGKQDCLNWVPLFLSKEMTLYVICYDLSADEETQKAQIEKWLDLLRPILSNPGPRKIILVGTRADKKANKKTTLNTAQWENMRPDLHDKVFEVSQNDKNSAKKLWSEIVQECEKITEAVPQIPAFHVALLKALNMEKRGLIKRECFPEYAFGPNWNENMERGLAYLHSAGDLIWINDLVCTKPVILAKKLADKSMSLDLRELSDLSEGRGKQKSTAH